METKIRFIISEILDCNIEEVSPEASLKSLGLDSLGIVELVLTLEEELAIEIPDEDAEKLETVKDFILYCTAKYETKIVY